MGEKVKMSVKFSMFNEIGPIMFAEGIDHFQVVG